METLREISREIIEEEQKQDKELLNRPLAECSPEELKKLSTVLARKLDETNAELFALIQTVEHMRADAEKAPTQEEVERLQGEAQALFKEKSAHVAGQYPQYRDKLDIVLGLITEKEKEQRIPTPQRV